MNRRLIESQSSLGWQQARSLSFLLFFFFLPPFLVCARASSRTPSPPRCTGPVGGSSLVPHSRAATRGKPQAVAATASRTDTPPPEGRGYLPGVLVRGHRTPPSDVNNRRGCSPIPTCMTRFGSSPRPTGPDRACVWSKTNQRKKKPAAD